MNRDGSRFPDRVKRNIFFFLIPINHLKCHLPGVIILKAPVSREVLVRSAPTIAPPTHGDTYVPLSPFFSLSFLPSSLSLSFPGWDAKLRIQWHANECTSSGERFYSLEYLILAKIPGERVLFRYERDTESLRIRVNALLERIETPANCQSVNIYLLFPPLLQFDTKHRIKGW